METSCPICGNWTHDGWTKIEEEKPQTGADCLVVINGWVQYMTCRWMGKEFVWADGAEYGESAFDPLPSEMVTHWLKLPEFSE